MGGRLLRMLMVAVTMLAPALVAPAAATAATGDVLLVVAAPTAPTTGESAVRTRLIDGGNTVTLADDDTVTPGAAAGKVLVIIGQSVNSNAAAVKSLASVTVPVWVAKPYLLDDYGLTGRTGGTDYGDKSGAQLTIADPAHPMAAGRTGTVTIQSGGRLSWGRPAASATVVATAGTDPSVFVIAPGAPLFSGAAAPACRLTFPLVGSAPTTFTATGWALFDAAVAWGSANCTAGPPPADDPPAVAVTAPTAGSTVSGTVELAASASDDVGVASVQFAVDGATVGTDTTAPYSVAWNSGSVAAGDHSVTATAQDSAGQTTTSDPVAVTVEAATTPTGEVLFVVAAPGTLTAGETAVRTRLLGLGFTVVVADDNTVGSAQATGAAFVLVSHSVSSNLANVRALAELSVPAWVAKPWLFDDFGLTGPVAGTDYADKPVTPLTIAAPDHAMAAGRTGTVTFQSGGRLTYGRPTAAATVVARSGTDATIFTLSPGQPQADGRAAPACRVTFPLWATGPTTFTADAWALFDAAARWTAGDCAAGPPPPDPEPGAIEHVVLVSVDGLNPDAITQLGATGAPTFYRLMADGAWTLDARTVFEATQTLPNHTSMVTSRPVTVTGGHRVTFNEDNGSTVHAAAGFYCASIFDLVHDAGGTTALYTSKAKLDFLDRSWNATNGAVDTTGADDGRDKIDIYQRAAAATITAALQAALRTAPADFSMIHYAGPDGVGHQYGYMSDQYVAEVARTDGFIGDLLDTIAADPDLAAHTVVIVTSDHGGLGTSHADATAEVNYTVPFFAWGAGVSDGADLYALNPDRADPGSGRPAYVAVPPVRNAEAGNLAADLLGFGPIPGSLINAGLSLDLAS
ncbi:hypothetical protein GCM10010531_39460 [Blastococcus jejuensis]|uniref:Type I phosphodiesterase / nucleotide pyrophosphatase n=1 Tax=Blastococcus jejuensis TaxID=351224 RepID=A0ABP6PKK2_9ACTN